ncbi:hypothetical protein BDW72DRAFT_210914 [Aspergillus terricola var. indicus]
MACGIAKCPVEILYLVLELLSPADWRELCLVNRRFRAIAEPLLYTKIQWSWKILEEPPPIVQFLRTVTQRPCLGTHVLEIRLEGRSIARAANPKYAYNSSIPWILVSGPALDGGLGLFERTGVPYRDIWQDQLREGVTDAVISLLLAQLSNLRSLVLGPVFTQRSELIGMMLRSAICEPEGHGLPDFSHLRDASIRIESMSIAIRSSLAFKWPTTHLPSSSTLKSLQLQCIREAHLIDILKVTPNLEKLSWEWFHNNMFNDDLDKPIVDLDQNAAALSQAPPTLTEINISADCRTDMYVYPGLAIKGSLHNLSHLHGVKSFQIPLVFLVGFSQDTTELLQDKVPRNIEHLTLSYDLSCFKNTLSDQYSEWEWEDSAVLGLLQSWLGDWKSWTPCLRGIHLIIEDAYGTMEVWDPALIRQLTDLGIQTGIQLEVSEREMDGSIVPRNPNWGYDA